MKAIGNPLSLSAAFAGGRRTTRFPAFGALLLALFVVLSCSEPQPPAFDGQRAMNDVVVQIDFGPRVPGTDAHRKAAEWLAAELSKTTSDVRRQSFFHLEPPPPDSGAGWTPDTLPLWNIIASYGSKGGERVMFCAHWDSRPWADEEPDSALHMTPIPGANDGASGVAVLLEMARILGQRPPPFGVDLVFFDGEDMGRREHPEEYLVGSSWFVHQARNYRPLAVVLLDMIGDSNLSIGREMYSDSLAPRLTDLVWETAARLNLGAFVDSLAHSVIDDHIPFLLRGIPAVDIIDFDYPHWHTLADTPDKLSVESLETVGRLLVELVYRTPVERYKAATFGPREGA